MNSRVKAEERVVLPRSADVLADGMGLQLNASPGQEVELMVCDFKDAFHTLPIDECEKAYQVFRSGDDSFDVFNTVVFGGVGSPLV